MKTKNRTLCQRLGIKLQDMANYLGVSIHMMAQSETGKRDLPAEARRKMLQLEVLLIKGSNDPQAAVLPLPTADVQSERIRKRLHRYISKCNYQARIAEEKLAALQEKEKQVLQLLELMTALETSFPEGEPDKIWAQLMQRYAIKKLEQNGLAPQTMLSLRISGLRQQETAAMEILVELGMLE